MTPDDLTREGKTWFTRIKELRAEQEEIRTTQDKTLIENYMESYELTPGPDLQENRMAVVGSLSMRINTAIWSFAYATGTSYRHAQKFLQKYMDTTTDIP